MGFGVISHSSDILFEVKMPKLAKYLVVDTAGFIKNVAFDLFGDEIVTLKDVVTEIRDKATKQRLYANPLDIKYMEPDNQSINAGNYTLNYLINYLYF